MSLYDCCAGVCCAVLWPQALRMTARPRSRGGRRRQQRRSGWHRSGEAGRGGAQQPHKGSNTAAYGLVTNAAAAYGLGRDWTLLQLDLL